MYASQCPSNITPLQCSYISVDIVIDIVIFLCSM